MTTSSRPVRDRAGLLATVLTVLTAAALLLSPVTPGDTASAVPPPGPQPAAQAAALQTPAALAPPRAIAAGTSVVSLTFDDGWDDQRAAAQTLDRFGLDATFYATSGWIGRPGHLTRADLTSMASRGHEIGGHTVTHRDLAQLTPAEARRQVCNDRATLQSWGLRPTSFAYPFASYDTEAADAVRHCGYDTARGLGDLRSPSSCADCPVAETRPPGDRLGLAAPDQVDATWRLEDLTRQVRQARGSGGWVALTFHHVCAPTGSAACPASTSITPSTFAAFASWLRLYTADPLNRTTVATVGETYRASVSPTPSYRPAVAEPTPPPAPVGVNAVVNPSLRQRDPVTGEPACFERGGWGTRTETWATAPGRTDTTGQRVTLTGRQSGDAKLMPQMDLGTCALAVAPGRHYDLSTWYTASAVTQFAIYYRATDGSWHYWTSSPWFFPATAWTQARWRTPPVPPGASAVSFGLALIADGTLVTDDYSLLDPGSS